MTGFKIGNIEHFYDKIGVAVVELMGTVVLGDQIRVIGSNEFSQKITSIQIEHEQVPEAKKGRKVGLKLDRPVKKGDEIFKEG